MIKKYGIAFLAFGEEHILEFNETVKCLFDLNNHLDIFVITDNSNLIDNKQVHIKEIKEPFNYNLKRKSIEFAFEYYNIVVFMDTDVLINKRIDFEYIASIDEGMEVRWKANKTNYMGKEITIDEMNQTEYGKLIGDNSIEFINEFILLLRIDDVKRRKEFIECWNNLNDKTINHQPNNGRKGSLEGLIMYATCNKLNLEVRKVRNDFFNNIQNVGTLNQYKKTKTNKTIL